jgi:hypothetical protein
MNLKSFTKAINRAPVLLKKDIAPGDRIFVKNLNSTYLLTAVDGEHFRVSGGFFDQNQASAVETTVTGCSWGGSFVKFDAIAVCGLRLEFGNRIITSPIISFAVFSGNFGLIR